MRARLAAVESRVLADCSVIACLKLNHHCFLLCLRQLTALCPTPDLSALLFHVLSHADDVGSKFSFHPILESCRFSGYRFIGEASC